MLNVPVPSQLPTGEFERLLELLRLQYAYPLPIPLSGKYFELLFAEAVKGTQEEQKLLFDVHRNGTGWSLKTFQTRSNQFEVVIQRCDILKDPTVSLADPVERLGQKILERFSTFVRHSANRQAVTDPRLGFLLRDKSERSFVFFQQAYRTYTPADVQWRWANDQHKSIMGFVDSRLTFRWYRSGTQLFGVYSVPNDAHHFTINVQRADLETVIEFFNSLSPDRHQ